jgi:hypothetical protein
LLQHAQLAETPYVAHNATVSNLRLARLLVRALRALMVSVTCVLGFWLLVCAMIAVQGSRDEARQVDAVVALDAARGPSDAAARAQLDRALTLHRRGLAPQIILTGAGSTDTAQRYLTQRGAPQEIIISAPSAEKLPDRVRGAVISARTSGAANLLLIGTPDELLRALKIARDEGASAFGAPARIPQPLTDEASSIIREGWAYLGYLFLGQ